MTIQPPPWWQSLLFEDPLPLALTLLAAGVAMRVLAARRRDPRLNYGAVFAIAAAVGAFLLAHFVQTDREALMERTRELVHATAPISLPAVEPFLTPRAHVTGPEGGVLLDATEFRPRLQAVGQRFAIAEHAVRAVDAEAVGDIGKSVVSLRTDLEESIYRGTIGSAWGVFWQRDADGAWRVTEIRWLELMGQEPPIGGW